MTSVSTIRRGRACLLLATTMLAAPCVRAQDVAAGAPPAATDSGATDTAATNVAQPSGSTQPAPGEIVVTATKRAESIQKVPISMQALTAAVLDQHQVQSFDDYTKLLPSVSFQSFGPGQSQLFFRGITSGGDGLPGGALPTSGVYLDEIPVTTIGALLDVHIYDVARVEALSGPQGTLYGASSLSGTLRIITNKPDPSKFSAGYDLQGNKFGKGGYGGTAEGFTNIPLGEKAAVRLVGFYEHDGGFIDNTPQTRCYNRYNTAGDGGATACPGAAAPDVAGGVTAAPLTVSNAKVAKDNFNTLDTYGGRAALGINLDDNWTVTPQLIAQHQHSKGSFLYDPHAGYLDVHDFFPEHSVDKWYQAALTVEGKLSDWDVLYSGGYLQRSLSILQDYSYYTVAYDSYGPDYTHFTDQAGNAIDPTQLFHNTQKISKQTHELRINSPADKPLRATFGAFVQRQANTNIADYDIPGLGTSQQSSSALIGDDIYLTNTHIVDRDYAMFAQVSYDILPHLTVTGGLRGFMYRNTITGFSGTQGTAADAGCVRADGTPGYAPGCRSIDKSAVASGETHKLNLTWQATPTKMIYATWSTGFRPGGNNRLAGFPAYAPDTLDNYEVGWKTQWFDRKLRINGAAYYETWNKLQYGLPGQLGIVSTVNAGDARVYGVEMDAQILLGGLTLSGSGSYNDAKLKQNFCPVTEPNCSNADALALKGTRLPIQPKFKGTATARYDHQIGTVAAFIQATVLHQGGTRSYLGDVSADALGNTPKFTTFDFSLGGKYRNMTVEAFIQNAFDNHGQLSRNEQCVLPDCLANYRVYPIKPQQFGIKVGQKF